MTNDSVKFFDPTRIADGSKTQRASSGGAPSSASARFLFMRAQRQRRDDSGGGEEQRRVVGLKSAHDFVAESAGADERRERRARDRLGRGGPQARERYG